MPHSAPPLQRTIIYIDGFNLYYGAVKGGPYKWLNLQRYFELIRPHDNIQRIAYFTAIISGKNAKEQSAYLAALGTTSKVDIVLGKYKTKQIRCGATSCKHGGSRMFHIQEEKRTDVHIALQMLNDAYQNACDRFILVSGDSDLTPALQMIKKLFPDKELVVYVPARNAIRGAAVELRSAADKDKMMPLTPLKHAQFASTIKGADGTMISKPTGW